MHRAFGLAAGFLRLLLPRPAELPCACLACWLRFRFGRLGLGRSLALPAQPMVFLFGCQLIRLVLEGLPVNPILAEIYSTIIPSAPFVVAAYALLWLVLLAFVFVVWRKVCAAEQQVALLEEQLESQDE